MDKYIPIKKIVHLERSFLRRLDEIMSFLIRKMLRGAMHVFSWFVVPFSWIVQLNTPSKRLPPIKSSLLRIPAVKLAQMIRTQEVTCETVIRTYIERCKEVNVFLNAIVDTRYDEALKEAKQIDKEIQNGTRSLDQMEKETPLLGLPLTVKESIAVKGMTNQAGRKYKKVKYAEEDAPIVQNAKKHGAIILLVSNTPELCLCWETYNKVSGRTNNPYDLQRTPAGSSGGEGALLGAGASLIGLGSDIAGSCRLPAMFNGVWGHKPTPFLLSPDGHNPGCADDRWGAFFTTGVLTRYAEDLPLLMDCVRDPKGPSVDFKTPVDLKSLNYFYMESDYSGLTQSIDRDIKSSLLDVSRRFNAKEVKISKLKWSLDISMSLMLRLKDVETIYTTPGEDEKCKTTGKELCKYLTGFSDSIFPSVMISTLQFITTKCVPNRRHRQLSKITQELKDEFAQLLGDNGVFFYPTFPNSAHKHYRIYHKLVDTCYMMVFNTLGLPVTQVMTGFDRHGLPIGIQVVTNPGQDHLSIAVAKEIERIYGGWQDPPYENPKTENNK